MMVVAVMSGHGNAKGNLENSSTYNGQEVGVFGRRRKWTLEVQTQSLERLSGFDQVAGLWLVESGFQLSAPHK